MNRIHAVVVASLFFVGCAHSKANVEPAKAPTGVASMKPSSPQNSLIVVYRNVTGFMAMGAGMVNTTLYVDQKPVGDLAHDTFAVIEVAPGEHMVTARSGMGESNLPLTTAPGGNAYAQMETSPAPKLLTKPALAAHAEIESDCSLAFRRSLVAATEAPAAAPAGQTKL